MKSSYRALWLRVGLIVAVLPLAACMNESQSHHFEHPSHVEHIEGSDLSTVTLTEKAIERTGLETDAVREMDLDGKTYRVVPYSTLIYDLHGNAWVYKSPEPRTFVRHKLDIHRIEGDLIYLNDGPQVGTVVASVGAAELYGTEFAVGH